MTPGGFFSASDLLQEQEGPGGQVLLPAGRDGCR